MARGFYFEAARDRQDFQPELIWKREDHQIALTRKNNAEEAAVGRNGEFAEGKAVKDRLRSGLENGNLLAGLVRC